VQNSIAKFFVLFHVEKLGTGESLQVLCVLGTGEGLTGCDGGFKTLRPEMPPTRVGRYFFPINNARTLSGPGFRTSIFGSQDLGFRTSIFGSQDLGFRISIFGSQDLGFRTSIFGSQDLGFRTSTRGFRTWISGPGFQALGIWLSGPGFQDLESSPSYGRLIFFPSLFSASSGHRQTHGRTTLMHPSSSDLAILFYFLKML
jgi:hypothetical protein